MWLERSSYARKTEGTGAGHWKLEAAIAAIDLDFSKPFLPGRLCDLSSVRFLGPREQRVINHVHALGYVRLMRLVEELVLQRLRAQAAAHLGSDNDAVLGLLRLCDEEVKHQELFRAVAKAIRHDGPFTGDVRLDMAPVASRILARSPLAVLMLTTMFEWMVQRHYLECFRSSPVDASFRTLLDMHWAEEAEHAKLDSAELVRVARNATAGEITTAVAELLFAIDLFDALLVESARAELLIATRHLALYLEHELEAQILGALVRGHQWAFLGAGLDHPVFTRLIDEVAPFASQRIAHAATQFSGRAA